MSRHSRAFERAFLCGFVDLATIRVQDAECASPAAAVRRAGTWERLARHSWEPEPMLARQRQAIILDRVRESGAVRVADLARELGVSDMTVRRDLEVLHDHGLLEKVHGGATLISGLASYEPGFVAKSALQQAEKAAIAAEAARLVEPGMAIAISAGTTTHTLAERVAEVPGVTVVTNSLRVADVLYRSGRRDQTVILTGGVRTPSEALVGSFAVAQLRSVHLDLVFMGVHGMDGKAGYTCPNLSEADTDRALIEAGRRLVVLADHTKWGVIGIASIARLDQADVLVSDTGLDPVAQATIREAVGEVILVDVGEPAVPVVPVELDEQPRRQVQAASRAH
jgi:DeoR/GlpR family transcriptional regulator of sugar metabolism